MPRSLSEMDFTFFLNQIVTEIVEINSKPTGILFENANLMIECPFRLRNSAGIVMGLSDYQYAQDMFSYRTVENVLIGRSIKNIRLCEDVADLVMEFDGNIILELFHDSNFFEGWQLSGVNGFYINSLPGGSYTYTD
jgi:hypothetical protein